MPRSGPQRTPALPEDYPQMLAEIKSRVSAAQTRAALAVNTELIALYWDTGHEILERELREGWGAKVVERLAADLRRAFPDMRGLSARNLRYMRDFARAWPARSAHEMLQQPAAKLPSTEPCRRPLSRPRVSATAPGARSARFKARAPQWV